MRRIASSNCHTHTKCSQMRRRARYTINMAKRGSSKAALQTEVVEQEQEGSPVLEADSATWAEEEVKEAASASPIR